MVAFVGGRVSTGERTSRDDPVDPLGEGKSGGGIPINPELLKLLFAFGQGQGGARQQQPQQQPFIPGQLQPLSTGGPQQQPDFNNALAQALAAQSRLAEQSRLDSDVARNKDLIDALNALNSRRA